MLWSMKHVDKDRSEWAISNVEKHNSDYQNLGQDYRSAS